MSDLFAVRVLAVTSKAVRLSVTRVHPDAERPAPHAVFALMLMYDPIEKSTDPEFSKYRHLKDSALAREVRAHNGFTVMWVNANAQALVAKVKRSGTSFLDIHLTHPAWGEHLRKGMSWRTTAYDMGPGLPAEPRAPRAQQATAKASKQTPKTGSAGAKKAARKTGVKKAAKAKSAVKKAAKPWT
ncbi:hypothetical protein POL68_18160 [Stigmatella sp. ncwal1]|uniref:Uncharacterized protein n=1 Tax=Stigmatella ashevillensis TaxID=2995309 RepID=A0ABT5D9R6_9BACT|nr:hypothetical protein [Stigmatella ashevillena]MDC0710407.1 hypothetical protein [Stigmatella ashevillena]